MSCSIRSFCPLLIFLAAEAGLAAAQEELIVGPGDLLGITTTELSAAAEAALDGGPLLPVDGTLAAPEKGDHWLSVRTRDDHGGTSGLRWIRLRVDDVPPEVGLSTEPAPVADARQRLWVARGAAVQATAEDGLAGVARLQLLAGDVVVAEGTAQARTELLAEGTIRLTALAEDAVGNRGHAAALRLEVDGTAPAADLRWEGPHFEAEAGTIVAAAAVPTVAWQDAGSGVAEQSTLVDGEAFAAAGLSAGAHTLTAWAVDLVGNRGELDAHRFRVDDEPPLLEWRIVSPVLCSGPEARFASSPTRLRVLASDAVAGVAALEWSADGSSWLQVEGEVEVSSDRLHLRATDGVHNTRTELATWTVDNEGPRIGLVHADGTPVPPEATTIDAVRGDALLPVVEDDGSGTAWSRYSLGDGRWTDVPDRFVFPTLGWHRLEVMAADALGNQSRREWSVRVRSQAVEE